jgi:hypothetical protein
LFSLDALDHKLELISNLPASFTGWTRCTILTNHDSLVIALPGNSAAPEILALDSGCPYGVKLGPPQWQAWRTARAGRPMTFEAYFTPNPGLVVAEEGWADQINFGELKLTDVPVMPANSTDEVVGHESSGRFLATLGFIALKRLEIIIDGPHGLVWLRPRPAPPAPYLHNRIGAVFVPELTKGDDLIAHVAAGGPAYEAGIRDGDRLQSIGQLDCTRWRTDPSARPSGRFCAEAGKNLELTVKRGDTFLKMNVTLRNILPPDAQGLP